MDWHRLVDGDPPSTGRYVVAHRAYAKLVIYRGSRRGWSEDVSFATHWAPEPHAPDDGTPQPFTAAGRACRALAQEAAAWDAYSAALAPVHQEAGE